MLATQEFVASGGGRPSGRRRRSATPTDTATAGPSARRCMAVGVHWGSLAVAPELHEAAPFTQERKRRRSAIARAGSASRLFAQHCERTSDALGFLAEEQRGGLLAGTLAARRGPTAHAV